MLRTFFKINKLQFSKFATAIDSSERLRNIQLVTKTIFSGYKKPPNTILTLNTYSQS